MQFFHIIILCFIFLLTTFPAVAGDMYVWKDELGNTHISDAPVNPGKIVKQESYRDPSSEEARHNERVDRMRRQHYEQERRNLEHINQYEAAAARARQQRAEQLEVAKKRAWRNIEDLQASLERYRINEEKAGNETRRMYWRDQIRKVERAIQDHKDFLNNN